MMKTNTQMNMETLVNKYKGITTQIVDDMMHDNPYMDKEDLSQQAILILTETLSRIPVENIKEDELVTYLSGKITKELCTYINNINTYLSRKVRSNPVYSDNKRNSEMFKKSEDKLDKEALFKAIYADGNVDKDTIIKRTISHLKDNGCCPAKIIEVSLDDIADDLIDLIIEYLS